MSDTVSISLPLPERPSARLLIQNPATKSFLLLAVNDPNLSVKAGDAHNCWVTPGGGVDPGETFEETAVRELWEETGLVAGTDAIIGAFVFERRVELIFGSGDQAKQLLSIERYFSVTLLAAPESITDTNLVVGERDFIIDYAWWTVDAIRAATEAGTDAFFPTDLADYLSLEI